MTEQEATIVCEMLSGALPYFPAKDGAQALISGELQTMCRSLEDGIWLAKRMCHLLQRWEGVREMRAIYCSKFKPADGIECNSQIYLDGIPSEQEQRNLQVEAPQPKKRLSAGAKQRSGL